MNQFDYMSAMHVLSNAGVVTRKEWDCEVVLKLNEDEEVWEYDVLDGKLTEVVPYTTTLSDIKAEDWVVVEVDNRTENQIEFDEVYNEILELLNVLSDVSKEVEDEERLNKFSILERVINGKESNTDDEEALNAFLKLEQLQNERKKLDDLKKQFFRNLY